MSVQCVDFHILGEKPGDDTLSKLKGECIDDAHYYNIEV